MLINIPFGGFYDSLWSDLLDREIESFAEYEGERETSREFYPETYMPEPLRVSHCDAWESVDYKAAYLEIARDYAEAFGMWLDEQAKEIDPDAPACGLKFDRMDSPREYNFRTDEIDCEVAPEFVAWMYARQENAGFAELSETLQRRHKSRDGFISFYSCKLQEWIENPVDSWDHNELRSLLESMFADPLASDWEMEIYEMLTDEPFYFDRHFDWKAHESRVAEERAELLASWLDDDPDAAGAWIAHNPDKSAQLVALLPSDVTLPEMPYRCTVTLDMFESPQ